MRNCGFDILRMDKRAVGNGFGTHVFYHVGSVLRVWKMNEAMKCNLHIVDVPLVFLRGGERVCCRRVWGLSYGSTYGLERARSAQLEEHGRG